MILDADDKRLTVGALGYRAICVGHDAGPLGAAARAVLDAAQASFGGWNDHDNGMHGATGTTP